MCRYPPSTIHRYLNLPSTQRIQTHTSHILNTTPPLPTLVQAPYPLPTYTTHTTATKHMSNTPPVLTGLVKPKPNSLIHSPHSPPTPLRAKHIHMSHTPPTPLTSTSPVLDKTPEPRVPLIHALTTTTHPPDYIPALPSPSHPHSIYTCNTNNCTCITVTATHNIGYYHDNLTNIPRTNNTTQTHRPSSKSKRNLIILQVNINGIKNKLEELKLRIHDTYADIISIQKTKLTPKAKTPKIHNFTAVRTDRLHKAGGELRCNPYIMCITRSTGYFGIMHTVIWFCPINKQFLFWCGIVHWFRTIFCLCWHEITISNTSMLTGTSPATLN